MSALEPKLTKWDLRVLKAAAGLTVWQIAEVLNSMDMPDVLRTLSGLEHLGYVDKSARVTRQRWWRTHKGDEAVAQERKGC